MQSIKALRIAVAAAGLAWLPAAVAQGTAMEVAAAKLQADVQKALPASSLTAQEKSEITADAAQLVTNAGVRAHGGKPDRKAGHAAGMDIGRKTPKLAPADAETVKQDLKALEAAAG